MDFVCSDERIQKAGLANPGSVLFDLKVLEVDADLLANRYREAEVTTIYSHDECGAARAALGRADASWDEVNAWAKQETKKFCDAHGFAYGHIPASELVPQGHVHPGTCIYVSKTLENHGGYRVSPAVATDPAASVNALLTLVAFKPKNGGDTCKATGKKFEVLVDDPALRTMLIDPSVAAFVEVQEVR